MSNTCEHGHLARKCEVCELEERASETSCLIQELTQACCIKNVEIEKLKAEIARLRSVCRRCSGVLMLQYDKMTLEQVQQLPWLSSAIVTVAQDMGACGDADAGKEPSDAM